LTLTTRLSVFFLAMLGVVLVGFSIALYVLADRYLHRQAEDRLDACTSTLLASADAGSDGVEWEPKDHPLNLSLLAPSDQVIWLVADDHGKVLDRSKHPATIELLSKAPEGAPDDQQSKRQAEWRSGDWLIRRQWVRSEAKGTDKQAVSPADPHEHPVRFAALSITVGESFGPVYATLRRLATTLAALTVAIWLVAFFVGRFVCRRALLPVNRMAIAASDIDANDFSERLPPIATKDELGSLSRAFNGLLDRLQESFERQRRFTGEASHQLRTPLTAILGQVEVALRRERPSEEYRRVLTTVHQEAGHLHKIVESLLFLARANREAALPDCELIPLASWMPERLETWSENPRAKDIHFRCEDDGCVVQAQPVLLEELLNILIDNACKYSAPGTPVEIRLGREGDTALICVEDRGCGIAADDLPRLFTPFFRSEEVRQLGIEGAGLGLSIAQRLSDLFGGVLSVTSQPGRGSCFTLRLSLAVNATSVPRGVESPPVNAAC
jgi:heavy metal sensor kinase